MAKQVIFDKKNVLVAGGAGFIGSHLCDSLVKEAKVICVDNFSSGDERNIDHLLSNPNFVFIKHDLSEPLDLEELNDLKEFKISFQGVQEIYNLACPMSAKNFAENKIDIIRANSLIVKNLLDYTKKYNSKLLHVSSSVVYGNRDSREKQQRIKEDYIGKVDHTSSRSSYDEGKRFAETMILNYREFYDLDARIVRLFRTYGPRMPLEDNQMLPDFINAALEGKDLTIFGDENFSSSFCYVDDVVDGFFKVMESSLKGPINIGSDLDVNLTELAKKIIDMIGSESKINHEEPKEFMTPLLLPDIYTARNELGWMPVVTLENGLKKTIFDIKANKGLRKFNY